MKDITKHLLINSGKKNSPNNIHNTSRVVIGSDAPQKLFGEFCLSAKEIKQIWSKPTLIPKNRELIIPISPRTIQKRFNTLLLAEQQMQYIVLRKSKNPEFWNSIIEELFIKQPREAYQKALRKHLPINNKNTLDIAKAKLFPITDLIEFKHRQAKCIFHNDKKPSLYYYPNTNTCFCFSCNTYADSIKVYQTLNNCTFIEAVKALQ